MNELTFTDALMAALTVAVVIVTILYLVEMVREGFRTE